VLGDQKLAPDDIAWQLVLPGKFVVGARRRDDMRLGVPSTQHRQILDRRYS